jgi:hypothetical protein
LSTLAGYGLNKPTEGQKETIETDSLSVEQAGKTDTDIWSTRTFQVLTAVLLDVSSFLRCYAVSTGK